MQATTAPARRLALVWLALILLGGGYRLSQIWGVPVPFDAAHNYLPAAERLLTQGLPFLTDPQSYRVAPLAYAWPALWQLDQQAIRLANSALFLVSAAMLWRTAELLGGSRAALLAAALLVAGPELRHYFVAEWTEPLYVAGLSALMLASARLILGTARPNRWIGLGACGLAMTLLVRPVLQLMAPAALMLCLATLWRASTRAQVRGVARQLAWMLALGILPAAVVVIKNGLVFGLWGLSTGSGAALYLGLHPLSQGTEPVYYGLGYDVPAIASLLPATDGDHLQLGADRLLREVAIETLKAYGWQEQLTFGWRKLQWWLLHHPIGLAAAGYELRGLRVFSLISIGSAALCIAWLALRGGAARVSQQFLPRPADDSAARAIGARRAMATGLLLLGLLALLAQLLPVLYNVRYSTGLLEPWLCVLTGVSWSLLSRFIRAEALRGDGEVRWMLSIGGVNAAAIMAKVIALGLIVYAAVWSSQPRRIGLAPLDPLPRDLPTRLLASIDQAAGVETATVRRVESSTWALRERPGALVFPLAPPAKLSAPSLDGDSDIWRLRFAVQAPDGERCRRAEVGYTTPQGQRAMATPELKLHADGRMREYVIHATHDLRPAGPGDLRIAFHCPVGTLVTWGGAEILRPSMRERWQALAPAAQ